MAFEIRPFVRENEHVLIALAGPSGGGKTKSAILLAKGLKNGGKVGLIDTEMGRARHYADGDKSIVYGRLSDPYSPDAYLAAIQAVQKAGASVIIIDSMSHEWNGEGGVVDWQEAELQRMAGEDYAKREACKMAAWIKPKMAHKKMMQKLLHSNAHLIFCLRAEEKVKPMKNEKGKTVIVPIGWVPTCEKNFMYEMTVSLLLTPDKPGIPQPIKLQDQHKAAFPAGEQISEQSGQLLAAWAKGGVNAEPKQAVEQPAANQEPSPPAETVGAETGEVTEALDIHPMIKVAEDIAKNQGSQPLKEWYARQSRDVKAIITADPAVWEAIKIEATTTDRLQFENAKTADAGVAA